MKSLGEHLFTKRIKLLKTYKSLRKKHKESIVNAKDYTLRKVAKRCGISCSYLGGLETGVRNSPKESILKALAEDLELNYWELSVLKIFGHYKKEIHHLHNELGIELGMIPKPQQITLLKMIRKEFAILHKELPSIKK